MFIHIQGAAKDAMPRLTLKTAPLRRPSIRRVSTRLLPPPPQYVCHICTICYINPRVSINYQRITSSMTICVLTTNMTYT